MFLLQHVICIFSLQERGESDINLKERDASYFLQSTFTLFLWPSQWMNASVVSLLFIYFCSLHLQITYNLYFGLENFLSRSVYDASFDS